MEKQQRNVVLDLIRIVAALMVIMIHLSQVFVIYDFQSVDFIVGMVLDTASHAGVPLFLMISGSLLLDEEKTVTIKSILTKNVKRTISQLFCWSAIYAVLYQVLFPLLAGREISLYNVVEAFLLGHYHLWFLYMLIGVYLTIPFLRMFVKHDNLSMVKAFLIIGLTTKYIVPILSEISIYIPELELVQRFLSAFELNFFGNYVLYCLAGWYIVQVGIRNKKVRHIIYIAGGISFVLTVLYIGVFNRYENAYSILNVLIFIYAVAIFLGFNNLPKNKFLSNNAYRKIVTASKLTFGVYILHPIFISVVDEVFPLYASNGASIVPTFLIVSVMSFGGSFLIGKIPFIRKVIRM